MTAPISNKSIAGGVGALTGGSLGVAVTDLLGQLPALHDANPGVVKALGGIAVVLCSMFGARWVSWAKKESDEFIEYAAGESGKVLVAAGTQLGVSDSTLTGLERKIDDLAARLESKTQADAERLLQHYFPTVTVSAPSPTAAQQATAPALPDPVLTDAHVTTETDPVLTDDYQPPADTQADPVLAD